MSIRICRDSNIQIYEYTKVIFRNSGAAAGCGGDVVVSNPFFRSDVSVIGNLNFPVPPSGELDCLWNVRVDDRSDAALTEGLAASTLAMQTTAFAVLALPPGATATNVSRSPCPLDNFLDVRTTPEYLYV